jgi:hypothetical protein
MKEVIRVCKNHEVVSSEDCTVCKLMDDRAQLVSFFQHIIEYLEMRKGNIDEVAKDPLEYIMEIAKDVERCFAQAEPKP